MLSQLHRGEPCLYVNLCPSCNWRRRRLRRRWFICVINRLLTSRTWTQSNIISTYTRCLVTMGTALFKGSDSLSIDAHCSSQEDTLKYPLVILILSVDPMHWWIQALVNLVAMPSLVPSPIFF